MSLDTPCIICGNKMLTVWCQACRLFFCRRCMKHHKDACPRKESAHA